jgi:hypothetical protein
MLFSQKGPQNYKKTPAPPHSPCSLAAWPAMSSASISPPQQEWDTDGKDETDKKDFEAKIRVNLFYPFHPCPILAAGYG